ncbi:hypothetical protein [Lentilactobacillus buchneri]|uniref:hypothetical protein n=1 Tax=Lentilactobacillus buchneri TaxID=1581 RepID=UPI0028757B5C|nr:hypothetical protein [Lentilactobacillus buchneri]MDS1015300.1 hypothetical protein [Lentilactobacillus buchneri]
MATPNVGILTNAGKNLIDQVNAGQTKITFSKIVFSSMNNNQLTDDQIKALTTVAPQEIVVNNPKVTLDNNTGETRIRATGNNEALTDGVYVKTYAVYAKDDSGNEILYGITVSPNPNYLPEYDGVTPQAVTYSYKVNISNTSNITFSNSNDIYVSDTDLAEALQPYAKTVDVNQQLDKKVIDNHDGTEQLNGVQVQPYNKLSDVTNLRNIVLQTDNVIPYTAKGKFGEIVQDFPLYSGFSALPSGTQVYYSYDLVVTNADGGVHWLGWGVPWSAFVNNQHLTTDGTHHFQGTTTVPDATSNQFIHSTIDNSHATYQITNLMIVVGSIPVTHLPAPEDKQDKIGYTPADDSKIAHLSGANNFDTVPTVNNNPLLLASSLPSDLARTGSDQEFTGKNTFDTAPIDKTTGNPYITKDGVPSDVARTGQAQTFTQQQTFSIAPVINDASTDKGDNQAATMADLKSVENSAWHQLDLASANPWWGVDSLGLYKIDSSKNMITLVISGSFTNLGNNLVADFSGVITNITSVSGYLKCVYETQQIDDVSPLYARGNKIFEGMTRLASKYAFGNIIIHYDKLV